MKKRSLESDTNENVRKKGRELLPATNLRMVTYNIDGLNPSFLELRIEVIIGIIISACPDVIHLQEVIPQIGELIISSFLSNGYKCSDSSSSLAEKGNYFTLTFAKTSLHGLSFRRISYQNKTAKSHQGRDILCCSFQSWGRSLTFYNAHLESCGTAFKSPESLTRQSQITEIFNLMLADDGLGVLGGDLNIRESEMKAVMTTFKSKGSFVDVATQLEKHSDCTWYMPNNPSVKARYDRIIFSSNQLNTIEYHLIGSDAIIDCSDGDIPYETPSDHRGLFVEFRAVQSFESSQEKSSEIIDLT